MAPDRFSISETDNTFEKLLIQKNGQRKNVNDVFEALVAIHHDSKNRDQKLHELILRHLNEDVRMSNDDFNKMIEGFSKKHEERDKKVQEVKDDVDEVKELVLSVQCVKSEIEQGHLDFHEKHMKDEHSGRDVRRSSDEDGEDFTESRRRRYTREQVVTAIIIALCTIGANATLTWVIIHFLEVNL